MRRRPPARCLVAVGIVLALVVPMGTALASTPEDGVVTPPGWTGARYDFSAPEPAEIPEDRYAMAGNCYAISSSDGPITRTADGFGVGGGEAEPFFFQATALGKYLLYGTVADFLSASEGAVGQAVFDVTRSQPGGVVGGLTTEQSDAVAEEIADSEANTASGRGGSVVAAAEPSDLADWTVDQTGPGSFTFVLEETGQALTVSGGGLVLVPAAEATPFALALADDCLAYPEIEVNVNGPLLGGETSHQEVRGYIDAHLHMMAFEFLGGRARCGRPWHRFGAPYALVDCPDHEPGGFGAVLEDVVSNNIPPGRGHNTDGWPTFEGWPRHDSLTHEQVYYKWLERAWRSGLRMFTNLLVDNNQLCKIYPYHRNPCNEMEGVRIQEKRIRELEGYIDAQSGGPGEGWFRIVEDPFEAREVINSGKLAVILGIEVSVPLDCGITNGQSRCEDSDIETGLDEVWDLGVRQMEITNKFDNAFTGVTGDGGTTGYVVNVGNFGETNQWWQFETCNESDGHAHDKRQMNFHDDAGVPFTERDGLVGAILQATGTSGVVPVYPAGPHCNVQDLSDQGEKMIRGMIDRKIIFDPDHMSARARTQALDLMTEVGYSGIVSSHGWADDTIYPRVLELGGVVTPHAGSSAGWLGKYAKHQPWIDSDYYFGLGFGSDMNGFSGQGGPPADDDPAQVIYPFEGLGGVTIHQQVSGEKTYDYGVDGVAHYGMYADYVEHVRKRGGEAMVDAMYRSAEQYLQMWERAWGIAPDACHSGGVSDGDLAALSVGMEPKGVLTELGQPSLRSGATFTYCVDGARTATLTFADGTLASWEIS